MSSPHCFVTSLSLSLSLFLSRSLSLSLSLSRSLSHSLSLSLYISLFFLSFSFLFFFSLSLSLSLSLFLPISLSPLSPLYLYLYLTLTLSLSLSLSRCLSHYSIAVDVASLADLRSMLRLTQDCKCCILWGRTRDNCLPFFLVSLPPSSTSLRQTNTNPQGPSVSLILPSSLCRNMPKISSRIDGRKHGRASLSTLASVSSFREPQNPPKLVLRHPTNPLFAPPTPLSDIFQSCASSSGFQPVLGFAPPPSHHLCSPTTYFPPERLPERVPLQGTNALLAPEGETWKARFQSFECVFRNCVAKWKHGSAANKCAFENEIDWYRRDWKSHSDAHYLPPQCSLSCENFWLEDKHLM